MDTFLTAGRSWAATALIALLAVAAGAHTARADYLVRTYADSAPAYMRSPLREEKVPPQFACREPLTVDRPHDDSEAPKVLEIDEAELAAALQALLVCAIPPPVDTIIQTPTTPTPTTPTTTTPQQPSVPAAAGVYLADLSRGVYKYRNAHRGCAGTCEPDNYAGWQRPDWSRTVAPTWQEEATATGGVNGRRGMGNNKAVGPGDLQTNTGPTAFPFI